MSLRNRKSRVNSRFTVHEQVMRLVVLSMLAALGFVLMSFAQFPYPGAPWLKIELSEVITLVAYALYGVWGSAFVAIVKTALNLAVHGPVGLGIGDLTALFTSFVFILGIFLGNQVFGWFRKGLGHRILAYVLITVLVTVTLTALNALFITPSYLTVYGRNPHFSSCFDEGAIQNVVAYFTKSDDAAANVWTYLGLICMFYVPFNLMKAGLSCVAYELVFNRVIFQLLKTNRCKSRIFMNNDDLKEREKAGESTGPESRTGLENPESDRADTDASSADETSETEN